MTHLQRICAVCDGLVDATTVSAHMAGHGLLLPGDWRMLTWPDGEPALIDPDGANRPACG